MASRWGLEGLVFGMMSLGSWRILKVLGKIPPTRIVWILVGGYMFNILHCCYYHIIIITIIIINIIIILYYYCIVVLFSQNAFLWSNVHLWLEKCWGWYMFFGSERVERCWKHTTCDDFYVSLCKNQCFGNMSILGDGEGLCWRMFGTVPELLMLQKEMFWWRGTIMSRIVHRIRMSSLMLRRIKWIFQCSSTASKSKKMELKSLEVWKMVFLFNDTVFRFRLPATQGTLKQSKNRWCC